MKSLFDCKSLIKVVVIMVVVAFMATQMTDAYAGHKYHKKEYKAKFKKFLYKIKQHHKKKHYYKKKCDNCPAPVPKTGQVISNEPGDDGDLKKGVAWPNPRFTDNEDGTITDNLTCLIWDKNANRFGAGTRSDALINCGNLAHNGVDLTDNSQAGDWRLPNVRELLSLIDYEVFTPALSNTAGTGQWVDGDPFFNVQSDNYWSSTIDASNPGVAFRVYFVIGDAKRELITENLFQWCVRDGGS